MLAPVVMVALPALALLVYLNVDRRQREADFITQNAIQLARLAAADQERLVEGARQLLIALSQSRDIREGDLAKCDATLTHLLAQYGKNYVNLGVTDSTGAVLCSGIPGPQITVADRTYFTLAVRNRTFAVGDYMIGRRSGGPSLGFGYPLLDPGGAVRGVVYAAMNLSELNKSSTGEDWPAGVTLTVTDRHRAIVARHPDADHWLGRTLAEDRVARVMASTAHGTTEQEEEGEARIVAFASVTRPGNTGLTVRVGVSKNQALLAVNRGLYEGLIGLGLLALIVIAGVKAASERLILRPISQLVEASQRLAHGDLGARAASSTTVPELSALGKSFDHMASTLEERDAARQRAEVERQGLERQYRQSQRMEAIGQLAGGVAHDFNNLLTVIGGAGDLALRHMDEAHPARPDLEQMQRAAHSAASLTRQLLAFSRQQILQPQILDLNTVVAHTESLLRRVIGENLQLVTRLAPSLDCTSADPGQVEQIIMNLVVNARDAMPDGGEVTLETANVELDDVFAARYPPMSPGSYVLLAISDTGMGMDQTVKARLFEPFFTTKERGKGTGLGLATVYGIVKQSGGFIWVDSEPDNGTTFKIYFPRTVRSRLPIPGPAEPPQSLHGTETVLLVEDQAAVRAIARRLLTAHGYTVLEASCGDEALHVLQQHSGPIELLLTDAVMPGMSGYDLATRVLEQRPDIRVLFASGYSEDAIVRHGILEPGLHFIGKPFTLQGLLHKVRDVLDAVHTRDTLAH
jgi:signal transduction histidine kinase/ActR/RegA family two-component response regulator